VAGEASLEHDAGDVHGGQEGAEELLDVLLHDVLLALGVLAGDLEGNELTLGAAALGEPVGVHQPWFVVVGRSPDLGEELPFDVALLALLGGGGGAALGEGLELLLLLGAEGSWGGDGGGELGGALDERGEELLEIDATFEAAAGHEVLLDVADHVGGAGIGDGLEEIVQGVVELAGALGADGLLLEEGGGEPRQAGIGGPLGEELEALDDLGDLDGHEVGEEAVEIGGVALLLEGAPGGEALDVLLDEGLAADARGGLRDEGGELGAALEAPGLEERGEHLLGLGGGGGLVQKLLEGRRGGRLLRLGWHGPGYNGGGGDMRRALVVTFTMLAGCNALLGIDEPTLIGDGEGDGGTATADARELLDVAQGSDSAGATDSGGGLADGAAMVDVFVGQPITLDGLVSEAEWSGATSATNMVVSTWGTANQVSRLRAKISGGTLFLAVEGVVETINAIVVLVDAVPGGIDLASFCKPESFTIDGSLSVGITAPPGFSTDHAWGTMRMSEAGLGDQWRGWRLLASTNSTATHPYPTACGATACETSIALTDFGPTLNPTIRMFVRLTNNDVGSCSGHMMSNVCVPEDFPSQPWMATTTLDITVP
jgi:hypothetical protein